MRAALSILLIGMTAVGAALAAPPPGPPPYEEALAKRLGADERGMKRYVLVILKTGPKSDLAKDEQEKIFKGHMANIKRLAAEGKLIVAGPLMDNPQHYEGIFVFDVAKVEDAEPLVKSDPAVAAGALSYELYGWYGSAAMMEIPYIHQRIDKTMH